MCQQSKSKESREKEKVEFILKRVKLNEEIKLSTSTYDIDEILIRIEKGKLHGYIV